MIESVKVDPKVKVRDPKDLLLLPKVVYVQQFDEEGAKNFRLAFSLAHRTGQPFIPVIIDSYGGDPYALLSMVDTIKTATVPVATVIEGKAMSCGAVLFSCGTDGYRFMGPNSTLMIHDVTLFGDVSKKTEEVKSDAKETDRVNKKLYRIMDRNCGHTMGSFWKMVQERGRTDWYVTPKEALNLNLANHISIPVLKTEVRVTMKLDF
jgi:ATP-dependent Clp protease protease subunit